MLHYGEWVQRAQRQQQRTVEISPQRGIIYDRNGQELAMTVQVDSVFAVPSEIPDQKNTATLLANLIGDDPDSVLERMQSQKNFAWIARKVDGETAARIKSLNLRGIYFQKELKRFYPKKALAAQVLGYVGMEDTGLAGIEHLYQGQLNGVKGRVVITMDARRKWFGHMEHPPEPGANVVLTIDEKIQFIAEKELEQAMEETQAVSGTVVVQNPRTGEILALANAPSFNPNLSREITPEKLKNHAVSDVYEPGSVFKTVTYSSVFEEKLARPEEVINCDPGYIMVGGIRIHDSHHIGTVTLEKAYAESSDVGAVKMALRLGPERFYKHIHDYGFGQLTNVELPGETRGLVRNPNRWAASSIGSMAIGQEVGVTPLQVVSMMSSIANDGLYSPPRIVAGVTPPNRGISAHRVSSPGAAPRHLFLHRRRHAPADRRGGAGRHGAPRHSGWLHLGGKDGHRAEDRSAHPRLFEDGLRCELCRLCPGQQSCADDCGDSGFAARAAPGRAGLGAGLQAGRRTGAGLLWRASRRGAEE